MNWKRAILLTALSGLVTILGLRFTEAQAQQRCYEVNLRYHSEWGGNSITGTICEKDR